MAAVVTVNDVLACPQPPTDDDLVLWNVQRADQVPGRRVVGHEHVDGSGREPADDDLKRGGAGPADVAIVPLDQRITLRRWNSLDRPAYTPTSPSS